MKPAKLQIRGPAEIYLLPGNFYFSDEAARIHTVLGSCVSIALWHPVLHIGGMCHSMLPCRGKGKPDNHHLDGRYVDDAIKLILHEIGKRNTCPCEYLVKLFGGGNMSQHAPAGLTLNVARDNIEAARVLLKEHGFEIHAEHVGGSGHRRIIFDLCDGSVLMKHQKL